jgi:hypothetical protein
VNWTESGFKPQVFFVDLAKVRATIERSKRFLPVRREHKHVQERKQTSLLEHEHTEKVLEWQLVDKELEAEVLEEKYTIRCERVVVHLECPRLIFSRLHVGIDYDINTIPSTAELSFYNTTKVHFSVPVPAPGPVPAAGSIAYAFGLPTQPATCQWTAECV